MANYTVYQGTDSRYPSVRIRFGAKPTNPNAAQPKQIALVFDKGQTAAQMTTEIQVAVAAVSDTDPAPATITPPAVPVAVIGDFPLP